MRRKPLNAFRHWTRVQNEWPTWSSLLPTYEDED
jgi:hypothetical protein